MELYINISRFHPLLVHLPIGILFFAFLLEGIKRWKKDDNLDAAIGLALLSGAVFALASVMTGLLLSDEGGYDEGALFWHKWGGIAVAGCSALLYFAHRQRHGALAGLYAPLFLLAAGLLILTGHYGGSLTHGADYLFSRPEDAAIVVTDIETANAFETVVNPILKEKCSSCHNPAKAKGELVMATPEGLLAGGKSGPVFNAERPAESEFLRRIRLPENEKKHMPPQGKKQLTAEEIQLLEWWVQNKACFDCAVQSMEGNEAVQSILGKYTTANANIAAVKARPVKAASLKKLNEEGLRVYPVAEGSPLLVANLSHHQGLGRPTLGKLRKVRRNIVELNLSHSNFSDELSGILRQFTNLNKLQLQQTKAGDKAIRQLEKLPYLESLNIYGTAVSDASLDKLKALPALRYLYCWQSAMSEAAISELKKARPRLEVQSRLDEDLFGGSKLNPPLIEAASELFVDSMVVRLVSNFRNTDIYYTIGGAEPDTCSALYTDSIVIREAGTLKAFACKAGWEASPVEERQFFRAGIKARKVALAQPPHEKYKAGGAASLADLQKGSLVFTDGNWLGYEGMHMAATLELAREEEVREVVVSALSAPASWIFFPKGFRAWLSRDGVSFQLAQELSLPEPEPGATAALQYFGLAFDPGKARYVKVEVLSRLKNPEWHPAPGEKCWIFIDEILIN